jgi:hypothetical protein
VDVVGSVIAPTLHQRSEPQAASSRSDGVCLGQADVAVELTNGGQSAYDSIGERILRRRSADEFNFELRYASLQCRRR